MPGTIMTRLGPNTVATMISSLAKSTLGTGSSGRHAFQSFSQILTSAMKPDDGARSSSDRSLTLPDQVAVGSTAAAAAGTTAEKLTNRQIAATNRADMRLDSRKR